MSENPRWLGVVEARPDLELIDSLTTRLREAESLVQLTLYPEWPTFTEFAKDQEKEATKGLASHASTMEEVIEYRAKLRIALWFQEFPEEIRRERDNLMAALQQLEVPKED